MKPRILVFTSTFPRWQNDTDPPFVYELSKKTKLKIEIDKRHFKAGERNAELVRLVS